MQYGEIQEQLLKKLDCSAQPYFRHPAKTAESSDVRSTGAADRPVGVYKYMSTTSRRSCLWACPFHPASSLRSSASRYTATV